jgi:peptidoglycan hydrolase CwlO-like protein
VWNFFQSSIQSTKQGIHIPQIEKNILSPEASTHTDTANTSISEDTPKSLSLQEFRQQKKEIDNEIHSIQTEIEDILQGNESLSATQSQESPEEAPNEATPFAMMMLPPAA